ATLVISDYGHHPSEIKALLAAVKGLDRTRKPGGRIRAVFQPHRYTRTLALGAQFPGAFRGADEVVLVPVYAASEKMIAGGTIFDLYALWRKQRAGAGTGNAIPPALLAGSLEQAWQYLSRTQRVGETLLVVGAGDVEKIAEWARDQYAGKRKVHAASRRVESGLKLDHTLVRRDEPLARKTTFGVGGSADVWMEIGSVADLRKVMRRAARLGLPFRLLGGGSNILACDTGVRGISARLTGEEFRRIHVGGMTVTAGAGVPLVRLLACLEKNGLAGLEFLEGIPGTVGGALRMNAGAWGDEIGKHIAWVRHVDDSGEVKVVRNPVFSYRCGLASAAIVEAAFVCFPGTTAAIAGLRRNIAARRAWMKGLRCAGSVFRNPPGDFAGRLIDEAGLKGLTVGGAMISKRHANVIITRKGACASDVLALIGMARTAVRLKCGVELDTEVEIL
ncbi:MAG: UDP-N-acetylmuramate dehydrogenase, partial [bacterium]